MPARFADEYARLQPELREMSGLRMLVLYGSRARGDAHAGSDWDFGYLADSRVDPDALLALLAERLGAERIDLVNLGRAGALLRHRAARDGVVIFEHEPGTFQRYSLDAIVEWCDMEPVLSRIYAGVLEQLRA